MISKMTIDEWGTKRWKNEKGELHCEDGPAIKGLNGYKAYYIEGLRHRIDGPSREWPYGDKDWWIRGKHITYLVRKCLEKTGFPEDVHLGILADRMQELGDTRLAEIIQEGTKCEISI